MAVNRFYNPVQVPYQSQFVPTEIPFDFLLKAGASKQDKEDKLRAQELQDKASPYKYKGLDTIRTIVGDKEFKTGDAEKAAAIQGHITNRIDELSTKLGKERSNQNYQSEYKKLINELNPYLSELQQLDATRQGYETLAKTRSQFTDYLTNPETALAYDKQVLGYVGKSPFGKTTQFTEATAAKRYDVNKLTDDAIAVMKPIISAWEKEEGANYKSGEIKQLKQDKIGKGFDDFVKGNADFQNHLQSVMDSQMLYGASKEEAQKYAEQYMTNLRQSVQTRFEQSESRQGLSGNEGYWKKLEREDKEEVSIPTTVAAPAGNEYQQMVVDALEKEANTKVNEMVTSIYKGDGTYTEKDLQNYLNQLPVDPKTGATADAKIMLQGQKVNQMAKWVDVTNGKLKPGAPFTAEQYQNEKYKWDKAIINRDIATNINQELLDNAITQNPNLGKTYTYLQNNFGSLLNNGAADLKQLNDRLSKIVYSGDTFNKPTTTGVFLSADLLKVADAIDDMGGKFKVPGTNVIIDSKQLRASADSFKFYNREEVANSSEAQRLIGVINGAKNMTESAVNQYNELQTSVAKANVGGTELYPSDTGFQNTKEGKAFKGAFVTSPGSFDMRDIYGNKITNLGQIDPKNITMEVSYGTNTKTVGPVAFKVNTTTKDIFGRDVTNTYTVVPNENISGAHKQIIIDGLENQLTGDPTHDKPIENNLLSLRNDEKITTLKSYSNQQIDILNNSKDKISTTTGSPYEIINKNGDAVGLVLRHVKDPNTGVISIEYTIRVAPKNTSPMAGQSVVVETKKASDIEQVISRIVDLDMQGKINAIE